MLKITIDATPVLTKPSGVGIYILNLIKYLQELQYQNGFEVSIIYQPSFKNWLTMNSSIPENINKNFDVHVLPIPVRISNLLNLISNNKIINYKKIFGMPDIIHGTNYSVFPCSETLNLMTIYDLSFIKYPEYTTSTIQKYITRVKQSLPWTDAIVTISENSKRDIIEYLQISADRVHVTPLASRYHANFLTDADIEEIDRVIDYDFSQPYLLFVGNIEPRKNIKSLLLAFNILKERYKIPHNLILIGQKAWKYESIFQEIANSPWQENIYHLDYLSDKSVALFYLRADVFVYLSHYEGFGLPVLEAMTLGTPTVTSNTSSLPEVAGDAALLVDPLDVEAQVDAILQIISDTQFRQQLIARGKERAALFSWERTAKETLSVYQSIRKISKQSK